MPATLFRLLHALARRGALVVVSAVMLIGCAHHDGRTTASRALVGAGAATMVIGLLLAGGGCDEVSEGNGCAGAPDGDDVGAGLPVMAAGAAMIAGGIAARPKHTGKATKSTAPAATPAPAPEVSEEPKTEPSAVAPKTYSPGPRIELLEAAP